jgi:hypothetical protein
VGRPALKFAERDLEFDYCPPSDHTDTCASPKGRPTRVARVRTPLTGPQDAVHRCGISLETVRSATSIPSFKSSPWILGQGIRLSHTPDKSADLGADGRAATSRLAGALGPVQAEAAPPPTQDGIGRHDHEGRSPPCPFRLALPGPHGGTAGGWRVGSPRLGPENGTDETGFAPILGPTAPAGGRRTQTRRTHGPAATACRYTQREARSYAASRL